MKSIIEADTKVELPTGDRPETIRDGGKRRLDVAIKAERPSGERGPRHDKRAGVDAALI